MIMVKHLMKKRTHLPVLYYSSGHARHRGDAYHSRIQSKLRVSMIMLRFSGINVRFSGINVNFSDINVNFSHSKLISFRIYFD